MNMMTTTSMEGSGMDLTTLMTNASNGTSAPRMPQGGGLRNVVEIILFVVLAIAMFGIGCGVDLEKLLSHFKKPTGAVIGILCQFVIMPLTSFILALILQMSDIRTLMLLILGSCPGGSISNVAVVWVDGDVDLSVCMTTVSCVLAFGVMPLLLFIYSFAFSDSLQVPFQSIGITLVIIVVPMAIGAIFTRKQPRIGAILLKVLSALGILAVIVLIVLAAVTYGRVYSLVVGQVIASIVLPFCGLTLGYGLASLIGLYRPFRLKHFQRRTIAMETGIQNSQLALGIISLSGFSLPEVGQVIFFPVIYLAGQAMWILLMIAIYKVYQRYHPIQNNEDDISLQKDVSLSDEKHENGDRSISDFSNPAFLNNEPPPKYSEIKETQTTAF